MHGRLGKLFSDSLFCNCPKGLLSSVEHRQGGEARLERDFLSLTRVDTLMFRRGSLRWKRGGGKTQAAGAHLSERRFRGSMDVSPE